MKFFNINDVTYDNMQIYIQSKLPPIFETWNCTLNQQTLFVFDICFAFDNEIDNITKEKQMPAKCQTIMPKPELIVSSIGFQCKPNLKNIF